MILAAAAFLFLPMFAQAHQPRIIEAGQTEIKNPEISQAFYGELKGEPADLYINSEKDFRLYIGLLVPDVPGARKDLSVDINRIVDGRKQPVAFLDGANFSWTPFFEKFARDNYFWGPEYKADDSQKGTALKGRQVPAGIYLIEISSPENLGKYSLAVGDTESFPILEMVHAGLIVPQLKAKFFGESPLTIISSPFGWGYILFLFLLAFIFGFIYRSLLKFFAKGRPFGRTRNIGLPDRLVRAGLGSFLLVFALATSWNPVLIFVSGFCFFEAVFSWCGVYAALGRNSCPI